MSLEDRFKCHPPRSSGDVTLHEAVRSSIYRSVELFEKVIPDGREKDIMMTKLEEAMFWANAALARDRGKHHSGSVTGPDTYTRPPPTPVPSAGRTRTP